MVPRNRFNSRKGLPIQPLSLIGGNVELKTEKYLHRHVLCRRCKKRPHNKKHAWCKPCQAAYYQEKRKDPEWLKLQARRAREFRRDNPAHMKKLYRKHNLKHTGGATVEWYEEQFKKQRGRCGICRAKPRPVRPGGIPRLHADHDHKTGRLRGLLCAKCNWALTRIEEVPSWYDRAIAFLAKRK
jgi:hypothetical protein